MMDESTTEQAQQGNPTAPAPGEQINQQPLVDHQKGDLKEAERFFFNNSGAALDVPPADAPEDDEMKAIRSEWTFYPAEVNKSVPHDVFDEAIGTTSQVGDQVVTADREMVRRGVAEIRALVGDLGMNREEATSFVENIKRIGKGSPIPEDQRIAGRESAVERLNAEHGEQAALALRASRAYIAKNPKLGSLLERSGLGDDPATVVTIARRALALHRAGKLKVK